MKEMQDLSKQIDLMIQLIIMKVKIFQKAL